MNRIGERRGRRPGDRAGYRCYSGRGTVRQFDAIKSGPGAPGSTTSFRFSNSILAVLFALGLAACGGGGGSATGSGDNGGPRGPVSGNSGKQPGLTAGGVTVSMVNSPPTTGVEHTNFTIRKGVTRWATPANHTLGAPSTDWAADTRLSGVSTLETTERFHAVTDYATEDDDDYLAYGFWSRNTPDTLDASGFQSFFYGNMPYAGNVRALATGNATYTGGAAGVYRIEDTDDYGYFQANVQLTASFGEGGRVEARMTGITSQSGSPSFNFGDSPPLFADYSGGNRFAGRSHGPVWGGQFFGPSGSGQNPSGVAGWFEKVPVDDPAPSDPLNPGRAHLSGSFGAK